MTDRRFRSWPDGTQKVVQHARPKQILGHTLSLGIPPLLVTLYMCPSPPSLSTLDAESLRPGLRATLRSGSSRRHARNRRRTDQPLIHHSERHPHPRNCLLAHHRVLLGVVPAAQFLDLPQLLQMHHPVVKGGGPGVESIRLRGVERYGGSQESSNWQHLQPRIGARREWPFS